jgi:hypothetical protein
MSSSPDHCWVPKSTPQRDRLSRFFTKSVGALYAGLLVLFQGRNVRGGRALVPTEEWDTAHPPPTPIGGGVPSKLNGKTHKGVALASNSVLMSSQNKQLEFQRNFIKRFPIFRSRTSQLCTQARQPEALSQTQDANKRKAPTGRLGLLVKEMRAATLRHAKLSSGASCWIANVGLSSLHATSRPHQVDDKPSPRPTTTTT